jgi:hypothetical protein
VAPPLIVNHRRLVDHGFYLIDIVPGLAWGEGNWEPGRGKDLAFTHMLGRLRSTGCDQDLALRLFSDQHAQAPSERVSLNTFCEILTSLSTALVK